MEQPVTSETPFRICYFDAGRVDSPFGELRGFCVLDAAGRNLGNVAGIVADLSARRVCYWVVARNGWLGSLRQLIPFDPARLERSQHAVRLESDTGELAECRKFNSEAFPNVSDEDFLAALFSPTCQRAIG